MVDRNITHLQTSLPAEVRFAEDELVDDFVPKK